MARAGLRVLGRCAAGHLRAVAEATDPAKLQPRVRPTFRQAAEHLRRHPPARVGHDELNRVLESGEAPWRAHIEREFRNILVIFALLK
jgi:hypothetical protein